MELMTSIRVFHHVQLTKLVMYTRTADVLCVPFLAAVGVLVLFAHNTYCSEEIPS